jgi:TonB family protein
VRLVVSADVEVRTDSLEVAADSVVQREFVVPVPRTAVFLGVQVDKEVEAVPGAGAPRYPPELRSRRVNGSVQLRFAVDTMGRVDSASAQVVRATHPEFEAAVRAALPAMRFAPAERLGRRVYQQVEQPFHFCIEPNRRRGDPCEQTPLFPPRPTRPFPSPWPGTPARP